MSDLKQTDLSKRLRAFHGATPLATKLMRDAADEIERYYTGMLNWKSTAEAQSRTQPEATAPAQDLNAAILALPMAREPNVPMPAYWYSMGFKAALKAAAALASSANALSAGDRVDAERYRWLREKRDILWKNNIPWCVHLIRENSIPTSVAIHGVALDAAIDAILQSQKDGPCES